MGPQPMVRQKLKVKVGQNSVQYLVRAPPTVRFISQSLTARSENMIRRLLNLM